MDPIPTSYLPSAGILLWRLPSKSEPIEEILESLRVIFARLSALEEIVFNAQPMDSSSTLGWEAFKRNNFTEAIECFEASNDSEVNFDAFLGLAEAYSKMRRWDQARSALECCQEIAKGNVELEKYIEQRIHSIEVEIGKNEV